MKSYLIEFLRRLEFLCPPPPNCHHAITFAQYGSDADGWEDRVALQVNINGTFRCFFFDEEDFAKGPIDLANEVGEMIRSPRDTDQLGVSIGRYS